MGAATRVTVALIPCGYQRLRRPDPTGPPWHAQMELSNSQEMGSRQRDASARVTSYLAFLGFAAPVCCYKRFNRLTR